MDVRGFFTDFDTHPGDRTRLFEAVAAWAGQVPVLYPGSFVDITPSVSFDDVTYADIDRRAKRFFGEADEVRALIDEKRSALGRGGLPAGGVRFHHADYREPLPLEDGSVGLLLSLYAGFVSEPCGRYLARGGWLLANDSHGDASMASLDPRFVLSAVVLSTSSGYRVRSDDLDGYMIPRRAQALTAEELRRTNRGVAFTRRAFAYLFRRADR